MFSDILHKWMFHAYCFFFQGQWSYNLDFDPYFYFAATKGICVSHKYIFSIKMTHIVFEDIMLIIHESIVMKYNNIHVYHTILDKLK